MRRKNAFGGVGKKVPVQKRGRERLQLMGSFFTPMLLLLLLFLVHHQLPHFRRGKYLSSM